jgi:hypothetical protein
MAHRTKIRCDPKHAYIRSRTDTGISQASIPAGFSRCGNRAFTKPWRPESMPSSFCSNTRNGCSRVENSTTASPYFRRPNSSVGVSILHNVPIDRNGFLPSVTIVLPSAPSRFGGLPADTRFWFFLCGRPGLTTRQVMNLRGQSTTRIFWAFSDETFRNPTPVKLSTNLT